MSIRVKVEEGEIVVTDPKTEWQVSSQHSTGVNGLVATQVLTDRKAGCHPEDKINVIVANSLARGRLASAR